jgi:hypothetical protein
MCDQWKIEICYGTLFEIKINGCMQCKRLGSWTGLGKTKDRHKEKTGLTRVRPGIYILTHLTWGIWESKRKA